MYCSSEKTQGGNCVRPWCAIRPDQRCTKQSTIPSQTTGQRNGAPDDTCNSGDKFAAVHIQSVRQSEYTSQIFRVQLPANCFTAFTRPSGTRNRFANQTQPCIVKCDSNGRNLFVTNFVVSNLPPSTAT